MSCPLNLGQGCPRMSVFPCGCSPVDPLGTRSEHVGPDLLAVFVRVRGGRARGSGPSEDRPPRALSVIPWACEGTSQLKGYILAQGECPQGCSRPSNQRPAGGSKVVKFFFVFLKELYSDNFTAGFQSC